MKRMIRVLSVVMCLLFFFSPVAEAVTFTSSGGSAAPVKKTGKGAAPPGSGRKIGTVAKLDLPKSKKTRLADSIELVRLTGLQASLAMKNLAGLDDRDVSVEEMRARLNHASQACDVLEKAGKRLEDVFRMVRIALENPANAEEFAAAAEIFKVSPSLLAMFGGASPAMAFDSPEDIMEYQMQEIGRQMEKEFGAVIDDFSRAAQTVQNAASSVGRGIKNAAGWVSDTVAVGHHRIGSVVGQKNWATIMAGTKFFTAVTLAGVGVVVVISAPAVSTAGAVAAAGIFTAANIGACVSLASDLSQILHGGKGAGDVEAATTRINQATSLIGLAGGDPKEITLAVLGAAGDEIANSGGSTNLSPEELSQYLNDVDREAFLNNLNAQRNYQPPAPGGQKGGEEGRGGGCNCP